MSHAAEVAQWVLILLGWLWLGEKGSLLAWPFFNGVLIVAIWWAMRIVCRGSTWALTSKSSVLGFAGAFTAIGVGMYGGFKNPWLTQILVICLAMVWGLWCAMIETRSQTSTFQLGVFAWHPLAAALIVGLFYAAPVTLLVGCAAATYLHDRALAKRTAVCRGTRTGFQFMLAPSAMGLMMGGLYFSQSWCVSTGWSSGQMIAAHLALMAGLPSLVAYVFRTSKLSQHPSLGKYCAYATLSLQVLGATMLWGESAIEVSLAMLLPSLAWAVHCVRPRQPGEQTSHLAPWVKTSLGLFLGPILLVWVGATSVMHGPMAMRSALAFLGVLAGIQWVLLCLNRQGAVALTRKTVAVKRDHELARSG